MLVSASGPTRADMKEAQADPSMRSWMDGKVFPSDSFQQVLRRVFAKNNSLPCESGEEGLMSHHAAWPGLCYTPNRRRQARSISE